MASLIAAGGSGCSTSVIPAVPAASSVTTIAFIGDLRARTYDFDRSYNLSAGWGASVAAARRSVALLAPEKVDERVDTLWIDGELLRRTRLLHDLERRAQLVE